MATLPKGEGVLALGAQGAYRVILFVVGWFLAGVAATVAVFALLGQPAHASTGHSMEVQLSYMVSDIGEIKKDIAAIECRINMRNVCPPPR